MRLFAYGGSGFVERNRIGKWSGLREAALSSKQDLEEADQFGVGLGKEGLHLIYRTWVRDERDGYAYTLLLAPSDATWATFRWNAALLLKCFLRAGHTRLMQPDDVSESELAQLESSVCRECKPLPGTAIRAPQPWHFASIGAVLEDGTIVASLHDISQERLPDLDSMIQQAMQIEPCFRIGRGWLIGGGLDVANALNSAVVLTGAASSSQNFAQVCARGRRFLEGWDQFPPGVRERQEKLPMHLWTNSRELAGAFAAIDDLEAGSDFAGHSIFPGAPFAEPLSERAASILLLRLERGSSIQGGSTRWLLSWLDGQTGADSLTLKQVEGLDFGELAAYLRDRGIPPAPSQIIRLSAELAIRLAAAFLSTRSAILLSDLLGCAAFLEDYGLDGLAVLQSSLEQAVGRHGATLGNLYRQSLVLPDGHDTSIAKYLEGLLRKQIRGEKQSPWWLRDAVRMRMWDKEAAQTLVKLRNWEDAVVEVNDDADGDPGIEQWLASLAHDRVLRPAMSLDAKRLLAASSPSWESFRTVQAMLSGAETGAGFKPPSPSERAWLLAEMLQMAEQWGNESRLPNLEALDDYLHVPATAVAEIDRHIRPRLGWFRRLLWKRRVQKRLEHQQMEDRGDGL